MGVNWTFKDYLTANGQNEIHVWLNAQSPAVKAEINSFILFLEASAPLLRHPHAHDIKGHADLIELRKKAGGVQYRPLCCYGPRRQEVTILLGASKKGSVWTPKNALSDAQSRVAPSKIAGRTTDHDFS